MICLTQKPIQRFFVDHIQSKDKNFTAKEILKEKQQFGWRIEQNKNKNKRKTG